MVENFDEFYENYFRSRVDRYDRAATVNGRRYRLLQGVKIGLAAFLPVAVALFPAASSPLWHRSIVVASVALIAVEGLDSFWNHRKKWSTYRAIADRLRREEQLYRTQTGTYADLNDPEGVFVERVLSLTKREDRGWEIPTRTVRESESE